MRYRHYSAADFANDNFFIRWVKRPDEESDWFWTSFIKENPTCQEEIEKARKIISMLNFSTHELEDEEVGHIRNALLLSVRAQKEERRDANYQRRNVPLRRYMWLKIAASVLLVSLVSFGVYFIISKANSPMDSFGETNVALAEQRVNPSGQKSVILLSDGTKVWLSAASTIRYAKAFEGKDTRDVYLEGEAFFDVAHNAEKPFIVHTSSINIKVLGTSFNVKSYTEEKTIETTLVNGKVRIERPATLTQAQEEIVLEPNQRAVFDKESKIIKVREVNSENSGSWKHERLVFDETPIDNVILQLERWYDVRIHVDNRGSLNCRLSAKIENESVEEVLRLLETSHDIDYRISGRDIFLEGTLCMESQEARWHSK
jgi:transmembrane sensor